MKITYKKAAKLVMEDRNWTVFSDNSHGVVYWNLMTGEILWIHNERRGQCRLEKPKKR